MAKTTDSTTDSPVFLDTGPTADRKLDPGAVGAGQEPPCPRVQDLPQAVFVCQPIGGRLVFLNTAWTRLLGYDRQACLDQPLERFVVEADRPRLHAAVAEVWPGGQDQVTLLDLAWQHASGAEVLTDLRLQLEPASGGVLGMVYDLTPRIAHEEQRRLQLEKAMQEARLESLGLLAGGIAHDFNNLLIGILGNADLALAKLSPFSPGGEHIRGIVTNARRAAELCQQMLACSGKNKSKAETVDLSRLIHEMHHLLERKVSSPGIRLEYDFAPDLATIEADAAQIRQVVTNLVTHAADSLGEQGGLITVSTGTEPCGRDFLDSTYPGKHLPEGFYTFLEVRDNGSGIELADQNRIFEPFFPAATSPAAANLASAKLAGRGFGLAAVLGIVRGHGGTLRVESQPGWGTTIRVFFPCSGPPGQKAYRPTPVEAAEAGDRSAGTILVVDDEEIVRSVARGMLELLGYHVLTAADGREAIEIFRQHHHEIVLVVLDLAMPNMGGDETFEGLRAIQPDARVVLSSGYDEQEATQRFTNQGLAGFIQKPYEVAAFSRVIHDALS